MTKLQLDPVLDFLRAAASKLPGFRAEPFAVLGNFSFQKLAMVRDLENHSAELVVNDVVAAIAGDNGARRKLGSSQIATDPTTLDAVLPDNEFAVVEADRASSVQLPASVRVRTQSYTGPRVQARAKPLLISSRR